MFLTADCWLASNTLSNAIDANQFVVIAGQVTVTATKFIPLRSLEAACSNRDDLDSRVYDKSTGFDRGDGLDGNDAYFAYTGDDGGGLGGTGPEFKFRSEAAANAAGVDSGNGRQSSNPAYAGYYDAADDSADASTSTSTSTGIDGLNPSAGSSDGMSTGTNSADKGSKGSSANGGAKDNSNAKEGTLLPKYAATTLPATLTMTTPTAKSSTWGVAAGVVAAAILMVVILALYVHVC